MPLDEYRSKRNFTATPEPDGRGKARRDRRFVVQKHDASRLHYDFRLEADGVLASWAVPRGPSMNPADKRLAVRTEDHPLEYADFEGVIPEGQYGAGPVIVWDRGTYDLVEDVPIAQQLDRGKITVVLKGEKLRGGFALVRTKLGGGRRENWLLIKQRDEYADPAWEIERPELGRSVLSRRTLRDLVQKVTG
jgi:bifunctional non-homologous end joining protein LigD